MGPVSRYIQRLPRGLGEEKRAVYVVTCTPAERLRQSKKKNVDRACTSIDFEPLLLTVEKLLQILSVLCLCTIHTLLCESREHPEAITTVACMILIVSRDKTTTSIVNHESIELYVGL